MEVRGTLDTYQLLPLLQMIGDQRLDGMLVLRSEEYHRAFLIHQGMCISASSTEERQSLTYFMLESKKINQAQYEEIMIQSGVTQREPDDILPHIIRVDDEQLKQLQRILVQKIFAISFSLSTIAYSLDPFPQSWNMAQIKLNPYLGFFANIARIPNLEFQNAYLKNTGNRPVMRGDRYTQLAPRFTKVFGNKSIAVHIVDGITLNELNAKLRNQINVIPQFFALVFSSLLVFKDSVAQQTKKRTMQLMETYEAADETDTESPPAKISEIELISSILDDHRDFLNKSYYEVLDLDPKKPVIPDDVESVARKMMVRYHPDRFVKMHLDESTKRKLGDIIAIIQKARNTLADSEKRREYDAYLKLKSQGIPTDVGQIFQADELFAEAVKLMEVGRCADALVKLEEAIEKNPSDPEYQVYLGWCVYLNNPKHLPKAVQTIMQALKKQKALHMGHLFLGHIAKSDGRADEAVKHYQDALDIKPNLIEAQREIRLIMMRSGKLKPRSREEDKPKPKLFDKFFKK